MNYRLKDIAKILKLVFKSKLNFSLLKSEISEFQNKLDVPTNPGVSYLLKSDIRFERYDILKFG